MVDAELTLALIALAETGSTYMYYSMVVGALAIVMSFITLIIGVSKL